MAAHQRRADHRGWPPGIRPLCAVPRVDRVGLDLPGMPRHECRAESRSHRLHRGGQAGESGNAPRTGVVAAIATRAKAITMSLWTKITWAVRGKSDTSPTESSTQLIDGLHESVASS